MFCGVILVIYVLNARAQVCLLLLGDDRNGLLHLIYALSLWLLGNHHTGLYLLPCPFSWYLGLLLEAFYSNHPNFSLLVLSKSMFLTHTSVWIKTWTLNKSNQISREMRGCPMGESRAYSRKSNNVNIIILLKYGHANGMCWFHQE